MRNLRIGLSTLIAILCIACSESNTKEEYIVYSLEDIINTKEELTYKDIENQIEVVELETPKDIVVSPNNMIISENSIILNDIVHSQIHHFDRKGKFLNTISARGKAENEYTSAIFNIFWDEKGNVCLLDNDKILRFKPDGTFVSTEQLKKVKNKKGELIPNSRHLFIDKNGYLYNSYLPWYGQDESKLIVSKGQDTLINSENYIKFELDENTSENISVSVDMRSVYCYEDNIVFNQLMSDTVFNINPINKKMSIRYIFDNPYPLPIKYFSFSSSYKDKWSAIYDITEDNKYIYLTIINENKIFLRIIDKATKKAYINNFNLNNPDDEELVFKPDSESDKEFVFFYDVSENPKPTLLIMKKF